MALTGFGNASSFQAGGMNSMGYGQPVSNSIAYGQMGGYGGQSVLIVSNLEETRVEPDVLFRYFDCVSRVGTEAVD